MSFFRKGKRPSFAPPAKPQPPPIAPKPTSEAVHSEFEISSAVLAATLVAKSDLTGKDLSQLAFNTQRFFAETMKRAADDEGTSQS